MTELRNTSFTGDAAADALLSAENARDANAALEERLRAIVVSLSYKAVGATTATIHVRCASQPVAVVLVRVYAEADPGALVAATPSLNFSWDGTSAVMSEPDGLTADTYYNLTFLVVV